MKEKMFQPTFNMYLHKYQPYRFHVIQKYITIYVDIPKKKKKKHIRLDPMLYEDNEESNKTHQVIFLTLLTNIFFFCLKKSASYAIGLAAVEHLATDIEHMSELKNSFQSFNMALETSSFTIPEQM